MPVTEMKDHVYKILELVGSSEKSIEDAIQNAITRIKDHCSPAIAWRRTRSHEQRSPPGGSWSSDSCLARPGLYWPQMNLWRWCGRLPTACGGGSCPGNLQTSPA